MKESLKVKGLVEALRTEHLYWDKIAKDDLKAQDAYEVALDYPVQRNLTLAMRKADDLRAALAPFRDEV